MDDFAERMRALMRLHLPSLSSRIYRPAEDGDDDTISVPGQAPSAHSAPATNSVPPDTPDATDSEAAPESEQPWSWPEAERRLGEAFDNGGISAWAECAVHELEAEGETERRRRRSSS